MYFVLYDRFLKSLGETYALESWSRVQRSSDFDTMKIVGEQIPHWVDPFFVVVNDNHGRPLFSGLASTPQTDDRAKKTTLSLKDYTTLFNSEIAINWLKLPQTSTLAGYIDFVLSAWLSQTDVGFSKILWDTSDIQDIPWDENIPIPTDWEVSSVYSIIQSAISLHDVYMEGYLAIWDKSLTFRFKKQGVLTTDIRLSDFGTPSVQKSFGDINRVVIYNTGYSKIQELAITENNKIVKLPSSESLVYPAKSKIYVGDSNSTIYDAVSHLADNRFQENIDLDSNASTLNADLSEMDFRYMVNVYTDGGFYKELPVGEIETDSKGKRIVRLGLRIQEFTQGG